MTCQQAEPLLARAADGTLDNDRRAALAGHLTGCAGCRDALDAQRTARALVAARPVAPVSPGFTARVMAALPERRPSTAGIRWRDALDWRAWTLRLAPLAGALFVAAALGFTPLGEATPTGAVDFSELAAAWAADDGAAEAGAVSEPALDAVTRLWEDESEVTDDVLMDLLAVSTQ